MPSRGRERGLLSSPTAAAGGRWVGSEGAGVAFMLRNRGPKKRKAEKVGTTSIRRKSRKKEGGIKGPQARAGGSSGSPLAPLLFKPPKKHREGPGKGPTSKTAKSGSCRNMVR